MPDAPPPVAPRPLETRWPCPVCVGVLMEKKRVAGPGRGLTVDFCPRCGGIWFDRGEVGEIARQDYSVLSGMMLESSARINPPCHECRAPLDRNAEKCAVCGWKNILKCPVCDRHMERRPVQGVVLDFCRKCQGAWFDNAELTAIWRMNTAALANKRRESAGLGVAGEGADLAFHAMFWAPDLVVHGGMAAAEGLGAAAGVAGEAAEGIFSSIVELIGGLFDGLS
jgi:Zn-finger nucleic acid-binding protein